MIEITREESESLEDFIRTYIFDIIRNDPEIDGNEWLENYYECLYEYLQEMQSVRRNNISENRKAKTV